MKPSRIDKDFYGCPKCGFPLNVQNDNELEYTGGLTCACGVFVSLPDIPVPPKSKYRKFYETKSKES